MPGTPSPFVEVGYVDSWGRLTTLQITPDAVPAARGRGWMVFEDFEALVKFNRPRLTTGEKDDGA